MNQSANNYFSNDYQSIGEEINLNNFNRVQSLAMQATTSDTQSSTYSSSSSEMSLFEPGRQQQQNQQFDETQEINLQNLIGSRNQNASNNINNQGSTTLNLQSSQNQTQIDKPITMNELQTNRSKSSYRNSFINEEQMNHQKSMQPLIEITTVAGSNNNGNHSSSLLINSSLISHNSNSILQSSNPVQSQAIAGAMKALQQKLKILQEQNQAMTQENFELQKQLELQIQKNHKEKEKFGELMMRQKLQFQQVEKEQRLRIDEDFKLLNDLKSRVENSAKALDKIMKENIGLRKQNQYLEKQMRFQEQENQKKAISGMQDLRENELKLTKKCKKLSKEKKDYAKGLKVLQQENYNQKEYYNQLINDLEFKLKEMINTNQNLNNEYLSFKDDQDFIIHEANQQLQSLKQMIVQGQFQVQSKESENEQLKQQLQAFQEEISSIKQQLETLSVAHQQSENMRQETENFVCEVVNVNEMLVQSIQKRKTEGDIRKSHNNSQMSYIQGSVNLNTDSCQPSYRERSQKENQQPLINQIPLSHRNLNRNFSQKPTMLSNDQNSLQQSLMKVQSLNAIPQSLSTMSQDDQSSRRMQMESELQTFQQKYDNLLKDIAASKMPLQMMRKSTQDSLRQAASQARYALLQPTNRLLLKNSPMLTNMMMRSFYYPDANHHHLNQEPNVLAKRIIKVVGERLRHYDPQRWDGVPITFKTNWNSENDGIDLKTCVLVADALEREFNIDIDDRKMLLQSVQECFHFLMSLHTAV